MPKSVRNDTGTQPKGTGLGEKPDISHRVREEETAPRSGKGKPGPGKGVFRSTMIDNLPGMAFRCRNQPQWPMEFISRGAEELTGYAPEELLEGGGAAFTSLIHPTTGKIFGSRLNSSLKRADLPGGLPHYHQGWPDEVGFGDRNRGL